MSAEHERGAVGWRLLLPLVVLLGTFAVFAPVLDAEFLNWDDDRVVLDNARIRELNGENLRWMFHRRYMGHYHPLTWLSYAVDSEVGRARFDDLGAPARARYERGLDPMLFHGTNLALHAIVALGLYSLARRLFRAFLPRARSAPVALAAAACAILFACHPMRVESVAWVTERRDVLSAALLFPAVIAYLGYARAETRWTRALAYVAALALYTLSLLGKAWGITLPFLLLALDVQPLRRLGPGRWRTALVEKVPFVALAGWFALQASLAQRADTVTAKTLAEWTPLDRIAQAFYGLVYYAYKTLAPSGLNPIVELPLANDPFALRYVASVGIVLGVLVLLFLARKRWPAASLAVACYSITLAPVLGFHQSGPQLVANRYSYLACAPLALLAGGGLLAWLASPRGETPWGRTLGLALAALACGAYGALARMETSVWQSSRTLWERALTVDPDNRTAHNNLGLLERRSGRLGAAIYHFQAVIALDPDNHRARNNLALCIREDASRPAPDRFHAALAHARAAAAARPDEAHVRVTLGLLHLDLQQFDEAIAELRSATRSDRGLAAAWRLLGEAHRRKGARFSDAPSFVRSRRAFEQALALGRAVDPAGDDVVGALNGLAQIAEESGRRDESIELYRQVLAVRPEDELARLGLARLGGE